MSFLGGVAVSSQIRIDCLDIRWFGHRRTHPRNAWENGAVLGREAQAEGDCFMATRLGISLLTNRPTNALPIPGVSSGDWGRNDKHLQLREAKPMGTTESLLKRVLTEAMGQGMAGIHPHACGPIRYISLLISKEQ